MRDFLRFTQNFNPEITKIFSEPDYQSIRLINSNSISSKKTQKG